MFTPAFQRGKLFLKSLSLWNFSKFAKEGFCTFDPEVCSFRMPQIPCIKEAINGSIIYEGFWERRSILFCALDKCIEMVGIRMISTLVEIRSPSWVNCHRPVILNDFQTFQIPDGGLFHLAGVAKRKRPGVD